MKKFSFLTTLAVVMFVLSACGNTATIQTDDGSVTINTGDTSSWCQTGADWGYQSNDGEAGQWQIVELVDDGDKYDGLCHVLFTGGGTEMDYYFNEGGETGFVEMTMPDGQKVSQSWSE